jgi:double-stranded uracil-DNA glycosylase
LDRRRPSKAELEAARGRSIPDVIAPGLGILFCGINPSLYSAATGCHFAHPSNRFWKALHAAHITKRLLSPFDQRALLESNCGVTNLVSRATARASELHDAEFVKGRRSLSGKIGYFKPRCVAFLGLGAYGKAFGERQPAPGEQKRRIGNSRVWVLPNPSGLNANYQLRDIARLLSEMRRVFLT